MVMASDAKGRTGEVFWGEIAQCEHLVQIYGDDETFLDALGGFVEGGLRAGEGVVVIATAEHLRALSARLRAVGVDIDTPAMRDQYLSFDADRVLAMFMLNGWPDDYLFEQIVTTLIARAGKGGARRVRAFGEMVALLWSQGHAGATVRLEHLWNRMCEQRGLSLLCAYPKIGFTQDADASLREICAAHSKVLAG
jgi:hypothetical protein